MLGITWKIIKLIAHRLQSEKRENIETVLDDSAIASLIWEFLEATALKNSGDAYHWNEILRSLANKNLDKVARIASLALVGESHQQKEYAEQLLVDLAQSYPNVIMERVGEVILSEEYGWHFLIEKYRSLIQNLPIDAVKNWLHEVGNIGAQRIARNLAIPYLDENGNPSIPPLTEFVLSEFEEDDTTFQKFCAGAYSLQVYVGDIASQKRQEVEIARKFLNHPLRRVREWAEHEISRCEQEAEMWHRIDEESMID